MRPKAQALAGCLSLAVALLLPAVAQRAARHRLHRGDGDRHVGRRPPRRDGHGDPGRHRLHDRRHHRLQGRSTCSPTLRIGTYTLSAELANFKRGVRRGVALAIQQRPEVNFALELGALAEEVVVSGEPALLQTQTGDMGHSVDQRQLTDLPLLGRRYTELALLPDRRRAGRPGHPEPRRGQLLQRQRELRHLEQLHPRRRRQQLLLDQPPGADAAGRSSRRSTPSRSSASRPAPTRPSSARSAGAVVNASIKQGSNQYRGTVFGFLRDEAFNANTWENEQAQRPKGKYNQYIYGATLGGPIIKNTLFFFGDYQGTRQEQALSLTGDRAHAADAPGQLQRAAGGQCAPAVDVLPRQLPGRADHRRLLHRPGGAAAHQPLPDAEHPAARSPGRASRAASACRTTSTTACWTSTSTSSTCGSTSSRAGATRFFARYSQSKTTRNEPPLLGPIASGDFNSLIDIKGQSAVGGWTRVLSPALLAEVRGAWNKMDGDTFHHAFGIDSNAEFGITGVPAGPALQRRHPEHQHRRAHAAGRAVLPARSSRPRRSTRRWPC